MAVIDADIYLELLDAKLEHEAEQYDYDRQPDSVCSECGYEWWCGLIPATRYHPVDALYSSCPSCDGAA